MLRIRTKKHEIIITPNDKYLLVVLQVSRLQHCVYCEQTSSPFCICRFPSSSLGTNRIRAQPHSENSYHLRFTYRHTSVYLIPPRFRFFALSLSLFSAITNTLYFTRTPAAGIDWSCSVL